MDDFGDFTGFNQDHGSSIISSRSNPNSESSSRPSVLSGKGLGSFVSADFQNNMAQSSAGVPNFATFDPDFNIPPPLSPPGDNIHVAGGVPFDIPPLPDDGSFDNFSPEFEIETPLEIGQNSIQSSGGASNIGGNVSHQNIPQPVADFGNFYSSVPVSRSSREEKDKYASNQVSGSDSGWNADFGSFDIPPPIDLTESTESSVSKNGSSSITEVNPDTTASKEVVSGFANFETVSAQKDSVPVESNTESFGDFNAFGESSNMPNLPKFASFGSTSGTVNTTTTIQNTPNTNSFTAFESSTVFTSTTVPKQPDVSFGSSAVTTATTETNFANFELPPPPLDSSFIPSSSDNENKEDDSFGDFSSSQNTLPAMSSFPAFENGTSKTTPSSTKPPVDEFGAFSDAKTTSTDTLPFPAFQNDPLSTQSNDEVLSKPGISTNDDFGDFSSSQFPSVNNIETSRNADFEASQTITSSNTEAKLQPIDDFGDFSSRANFATFDNTSNPVSDNLEELSTTQTGSGYAAFDAKTSQKTSTAPSDDFGDFSTGFSSSGADDGFGDFTTSSSRGDGFGDFTSSNTGFGAFSSAVTTPTPVTTKKQDVGNVLTSCFTLVSKSPGKTTPTSSLHTLLMGSKTEEGLNQSMWQSLQKCIDLSIPLYKWEKSTLQDNFYSALKVDPMLTSKPSTLSVLTGQVRFEDPLGGTTAAEDLVESFGFEGGLEDAGQRSPPPIMSGTRQLSQDRATPTLLDLSLPETPGSPTGQNSFTLAEDLLGLDLNPQPKTQQLTSIQELLRNEKLVVNKSNWVDPNLKEFGEGGKEKRNSQPSPPQATKKQSTFELQLQQLGLDANKVSSVTSENKELSLAARTVLGRLPELSFMLTADRVVQTHQYSI